ncbi:MAG: ABC transporter ATP-binding protein [Caulobacteraceae bacterium]|nr:ABC transporter ATP-binding protein [Caulobacteraceae bacterium]
MVEPGAPAPASDAPVLDVRGVGKRFGARYVVSDLTLALHPGEVLGFVGPNGAGKTTSLRILAGLLKADQGAGQVLGRDLMGDRRAVAASVGYMPQRLALYGELTVAENLRFRADVYGLASPRAAVEAAIDDFDLGPYRKLKAGRLSGGWARRLQLAAALIHRPSLVLLDEPTAGLDAESKQDVWRRILEIAHDGGSVVINTHDLAEAERCTTVALFSAGRVLARGDPARLVLHAPFEAMVIAGGDVRALLARFETAPGVIAASPEGHGLRLLVRPGAGEAIRAEAAAVGARAEDTRKRLEDAAFVLVHDPEAKSWTLD